MTEGFYTQKQVSAHCAVHALNHVFQQDLVVVNKTKEKGKLKQHFNGKWNIQFYCEKTKKMFSIPDEITKRRQFEICLRVREPVMGEKIASTPPKQLRLMRRFSDTESLRTLLGLLFTISSLSLLRSPGFAKVLVMEAGVTLRPHPPVVLPSLRHPHGHVEVGDAFSSGPASGKAAFVEGPICQTRLGHELVQFVLPWRGRRAMASPAHHLQIWQRPPA